MFGWVVIVIYIYIVNVENLKFIDVCFIIKCCVVYFSKKISCFWLFVKEVENVCGEIYLFILILSFL